MMHKKAWVMDRYELPVTYNGKDFSLSARLISSAYTQKFEVLVNGRCVVFEADEDGKYRAVSGQQVMVNLDQDNIGLLKEIASVIQYITD